EPLPINFARRIMGLDREGAGERWLAQLPHQVATRIREIVEVPPARATASKRSRAPEALTYAKTANREFELAYWRTIASLSESPLLNKNNADCPLDEASQGMLVYRERQLDRQADELLAYHTKAIAAAKMTGKALAGDVPFRWRTDLDYPWMGGWKKN